jgi:hypothetical protein
MGKRKIAKQTENNKMKTEDHIDELIDKAVAEAEKLGKAHGINAAEWAIQDSWGGRVSSPQDYQAAKAFLDGAEAGDPAIMDRFNPPNLSGEWADSMTPAKLIEEVTEGEISLEPEEESAICQAYETEAANGYWQELETSAANLLEMEPIE